MRQGISLLEAVAALTLLGVLAGLAAPPLSRLRDRAVVHVARESLIGLVSETRAAAMAAGAATLVVRPVPPRASIVVRGDTVRVVTLDEEGAVRMPGGRPVELDFDGLGLGRFASATLRFSAGQATATVVVSSYGRTSRR
jgi:type II secretory pathway pseudopilin PulG